MDMGLQAVIDGFGVSMAEATTRAGSPWYDWGGATSTDRRPFQTYAQDCVMEGKTGLQFMGRPLAASCWTVIRCCIIV
jgi:hypothetical protein